MGCHVILRRATIENRGGDPAQVQGYAPAVQRQDFMTAVISKDHRNCGCVQQVRREAVGIVLEPSAMPSSDRSIAIHFYFNILKPLGPAPKLCVQNAFPSMYSNSRRLCQTMALRLARTQQVRDLLNRKRDLIQTRCLICMLLSVNIPRQHRERASS